MTKQEAYAEIKRLGFDKAVVEFSGGGDEGGADHIYMQAEAREDDQLDVPQGDLLDWLDELPYEEYSFSGDFHVDGTIVVDANKRTVEWSVAESDWSQREFVT